MFIEVFVVLYSSECNMSQTQFRPQKWETTWLQPADLQDCIDSLPQHVSARIHWRAALTGFSDVSGLWFSMVAVQADVSAFFLKEAYGLAES